MNMSEQFISEAIEPVADSFDRSGAAAGEPAMPLRFMWRGREYAVAEVLDRWKESGREKGGSEIYLRKHWYHVRTTDGCEMKLYFERQPRSKAQRTQRWWLYTMSTHEDPGVQSK